MNLIPAIIRDARTGAVLTLAYMKKSRSRKRARPGRRGSGAAVARSCGTKARPAETRSA
jgi:phosphoribosyl-AMP cyclohydrolase